MASGVIMISDSSSEGSAEVLRAFARGSLTDLCVICVGEVPAVSCGGSCYGSDPVCDVAV